VEIDVKPLVSNETFEEFRSLLSKRSARRKHVKTKRLQEKQQMEKQMPAFSKQYIDSVAAFSTSNHQTPITPEKLMNEFPEPSVVALMQTNQWLSENSTTNTNDEINFIENSNTKNEIQNSNKSKNSSSKKSNTTLLPPAPPPPTPPQQSKKKSKKQDQQKQDQQQQQQQIVYSVWNSNSNSNSQQNQQKQAPQQMRSFVDVVKSNKKPLNSPPPTLLNELIASKTPFKKSSKGKQEYLIIATGGLRKK